MKLRKHNWHSGKHPILGQFMRFYCDLERLTGSYDVMHGEFHHIKYSRTAYSPTILDPDTDYLRIVAKKNKMMQIFFVKVTPEIDLFVREFIREYPRSRYQMDYYKIMIAARTGIEKQPLQGSIDDKLENTIFDPGLAQEHAVKY
jgi:hypothetical protein